jgi:hypothetical protein
MVARILNVHPLEADIAKIGVTKGLSAPFYRLLTHVQANIVFDPPVCHQHPREKSPGSAPNIQNAVLLRPQPALDRKANDALGLY